MELKEELEKRIIRINGMRFPYEDKYEFFIDIASKMTKNPDLSTIYTSEMLIAILAINKENYPFEKITDVIGDIVNFIDYGTPDKDEDICLLLSTIANLKTIHLLNSLLSYKEKPTGQELSWLLNKYNPDTDGRISNDRDAHLSAMASLSGYIKLGIDVFENYENLYEFTNLLNDFDGVEKYIIKYMSYKDNYDSLKLLKFYDSHRNRLEGYVKFDGSNEKYKMALGALEIEEMLSKIRNYDSELERQRTQFKKKQNKIVNLYKSAVEFLSSMGHGKIVEIPYELLSKLNDDELTNKIIEKALQNNRSVYSRLQIENIKNDRYHTIEKLFYKYGINLELLPKEEKNNIMQTGNEKTLEEILSYLQNSNWLWLNPSHPMHTIILLNTKISIIEFINEITQQGIVPMLFFQMHPEVLLDKNIQITDNKK